MLQNRLIHMPGVGYETELSLCGITFSVERPPRDFDKLRLSGKKKHTKDVWSRLTNLTGNIALVDSFLPLLKPDLIFL